MARSHLFLAAIVVSMVSHAANAQQVVWGLGHAKDGDTLQVGTTDVRLFGIDAPEFDQTCTKDGRHWSCGAAAADQLMNLVTGKDVECVSAGKDQYGRTLGRCSVGGTDVNRTMVELGYAVAYRRYSLDYVAAEQNAKASKLGIWAGSFEPPEHFRHPGDTAAVATTAHRKTTNASRSGWAARAQVNCNIKGNRNRKGQWIYHLPGMPYYDQTRPEEIFCSEAEAQAAGYRRAIVR
jgi:endonuclease YncB( thermonuclease family)